MPGRFALSTLRAVSRPIVLAIIPVHESVHSHIADCGGPGRTCPDTSAYQERLFKAISERLRTRANNNLAEREGFEPPIRLPVCRISSAVLSTTQPPLQTSIARAISRRWPGRDMP